LNPSFTDTFIELPKLNGTFTVILDQNGFEPVKSETLVNDVFNRVRTIENRYIDLANLYKSTITTPETCTNAVDLQQSESRIIKNLMNEKS
jgi:hypothetical protein